MKKYKSKQINIVALQLVCHALADIAAHTSIGSVQTRCVDILEQIYKDLKND